MAQTNVLLQSAHFPVSAADGFVRLLKEPLASASASAPLPVPKSAISRCSLGGIFCSAISTRRSVSGRGMRVAGETINLIPQNSRRLVMYAMGSP